MAPLSVEDRALIVELKKEGVLEKIDGHRIDSHKGVTIVACSDPQRFPDIFMHHRQEVSVEAPPLALFGGALLIAEDSPLNREEREDRTLLRHIRLSKDVLGITTVVLYAHAPCRMAGVANLTLTDVLNLLVKAKYRLLKEIEGINLSCFVHIDFKPEQDLMRSYYLNRRRWEAWYAERR